MNVIWKKNIEFLTLESLKMSLAFLGNDIYYFKETDSFVYFVQLNSMWAGTNYVKIMCKKSFKQTGEQLENSITIFPLWTFKKSYQYIDKLLNILKSTYSDEKKCKKFNKFLNKEKHIAEKHSNDFKLEEVKIITAELVYGLPLFELIAEGLLNEDLLSLYKRKREWHNC